MKEIIAELLRDFQDRPRRRDNKILADAYEDADQPHMANAVRWMMRENRRPRQHNRCDTTDGPTLVRFAWYDQSASLMHIDPLSDLHPAIFVWLVGGEVRYGFREYLTFLAAVEDLAQALVSAGITTG